MSSCSVLGAVDNHDRSPVSGATGPGSPAPVGSKAAPDPRGQAPNGFPQQQQQQQQGLASGQPSAGPFLGWRSPFYSMARAGGALAGLPTSCGSPIACVATGPRCHVPAGNLVPMWSPISPLASQSLCCTGLSPYAMNTRNTAVGHVLSSPGRFTLLDLFQPPTNLLTTGIVVPVWMCKEIDMSEA